MQWLGSRTECIEKREIERGRVEPLPCASCGQWFAPTEDAYHSHRGPVHWNHGAESDLPLVETIYWRVYFPTCEEGDHWGCEIFEGEG